MRKSFILPILFAIFTFFLMTSYAETLTATDDVGFTLTLSKPPTRIVSPGNTEILFALGLGDKVIGVTTYCDEPQEALTKEKVGNVTEIDLEKILTLQPDLILASSLTSDELIVRFHELKLPVFTLKAETIDQVIEDIHKVSILCGTEKTGLILTQSMRNELEKITEKTKNLSNKQKPLVFHIIWHDPIWTAGKHTFIDEFITLAGGQNLAGDIQGYSTIDIEEILRRNPSIITVIEDHGKNEENQLFQFVTEDRRFQSLDAINQQRVYLINSNLVSRPGPRVITALKNFAQIIHPEIFGKYEPEVSN